MIDQMWQTQLPALRQDGPETEYLDNLHRTFIQNVSHEMRTPLSIIQGYAELLHNGDMGVLVPEQQAAIFAIVNRASELRTLVERLGVLMAIEAHATTSLPFELTEVATKVVEERRAAATQAKVEVEVHLEPDLPFVSGDPYHLQQAVDCLVENALKFAPSGGRVEVQVYAEPGWVCLGVTDTGIGMEEPDHIFAGFYQIDGSTTRRYGGIGLGLTVAKAVIEEHAGQIEVESQPGQGSRFTVKLPALPPAAKIGAATDQPVEGSAPLQRILIVDDEEIVALILQESLESIPSCEVAIATGGEQALRLFEERPFDLLITDYKMPDIDGMTLAARVRQSYPQTAVVVITAYNSDTLREQAARASVRRILDKPVRIAEIRTVASEALAQSA